MPGPSENQHYPADSAAVESLISALDKIKVLDTPSPRGTTRGGTAWTPRRGSR
jgi:hypothetical protein